MDASPNNSTFLVHQNPAHRAERYVTRIHARTLGSNTKHCKLPVLEHNFWNGQSTAIANSAQMSFHFGFPLFYIPGVAEHTSPFLQFPMLETRQFGLRLLRPEDAEAIFAYKSHDGDPGFPRVERHKDISESQRFIAECLRKYYSKIGIYWAIAARPSNMVIGTVGLCAMHGDSTIEHRAEISCALSSSFRRQGIMTEARLAIINYAFSTWDGLTRIHSEIAVNNTPSLQMNRKLGFVEEGVLRQYQRSDAGKTSDVRILSLVRNDWEANPLYRKGTACQPTNLTT